MMISSKKSRKNKNFKTKSLKYIVASDTTGPKLYWMLIPQWPEWLLFILPIHSYIYLWSNLLSSLSGGDAPTVQKQKRKQIQDVHFCTVNQVLMCLHSRMGNNNWLKQSLLWENKRPGSVASEGQAWWHSKHLNSHWLPGRRPMSTSRSSPGRDRFTQLPGQGVRMLFRSHLLPLGLQSHLFP